MYRRTRQRWSAFAFAALIAGPAVAQVGTSSTDVRFIVAEFPGQKFHQDSYTLTLSDPADIAHARRLVLEGPSAGTALVVARIAVGSDWINRNWRAPQAPAWSWHLTEFIGFSDTTPEILDGWPTFVESDPEAWIANTEGQIGFWTYTVVAELPPGAACYANCDGSTASPILNVNDFLCFQSHFAAGDSAANCDSSTTPPVLNVNDFICFQSRFAQGCE